MCFHICQPSFERFYQLSLHTLIRLNHSLYFLHSNINKMLQKPGNKSTALEQLRWANNGVQGNQPYFVVNIA